MTQSAELPAEQRWARLDRTDLRDRKPPSVEEAEDAGNTALAERLSNQSPPRPEERPPEDNDAGEA